jgi:uncharacterized protein YkwD
MVLSAGCFTAAPAAPDEDPALLGESARCFTPEEAERMADQVLQFVNLERAERDLQPVVVNPGLKTIAENYACRMVEAGFFGHQDLDTGDGPAERAIAGKYTFYAIGENLAAGQETPTDVMKVWMESPAHREIILDPDWKEVGIAVRGGGQHSIYWVQEFGDPATF